MIEEVFPSEMDSAVTALGCICGCRCHLDPYFDDYDEDRGGEVKK